MLIVPASVRRIGISAAAVALVLGGLVAVAPASAAPLTTPKQAAVPTPPAPVAGHMGEYPSSAFAADAAKLPAGLVTAVHRDLGITTEAYLAQAAAADDASRTIATLKGEGVTVRGSRMEGTALRVYVSGAADVAAVEKLGAVADTGKVTKVDYSTRQFVKAADVYDGAAWGWSDGQFLNFCSIGFTGFNTATGAAQALTAGHCFEDINTIQGHLLAITLPRAADYAEATSGGTLGDLVAGSNQFGGGRDSGLIAVASGMTQRSSVLTWSGGAGAPNGGSKTPIYDVSTASVGESVCKSGSRTGFTCGSVLAVDVTVPVGADDVNAIIMNTCILPGDSGGSVFAGNFALGVVSASTSSNSCSGDYESAAFPMKSTGGDSVASQQNNWEPMVSVPTPIVTTPTTNGVATNIIGAQVNTSSSSLVADLYFDAAIGTSTPSTTIAAPYGKFNFAVSGLAAGNHTYQVKLRRGTWSVSTAVSGSFRKVAVSRIAGSDRFVNADLIAKAAYPSGATTVYVTNGLNYPDALSAGPVATLAHAPIVLTTPTALPDDTFASLRDTLKPTNIVVLGGVNSVSEDVVAKLATVPGVTSVTRVGGTDRFDASRNLAASFGHAATVFISNGNNFPDALSAGPAAATVSAPVLMVNGPQQSLPAETLQLFQNLGTTKIIIAGGPNSVTPAIQTQLEGIFGASNVTRFGGSTRYEASKNINAAFFTSASGAMIATGENFPDALAGGAYAGSLGQPLYTVPHNCVPDTTSQSIATIGANSIVLLGGTNSLNATVATLNHC